jgi:hypothetical protein
MTESIIEMDSKTTEEKWLTTQEICHSLNITPRTLRNWIFHGKIPEEKMSSIHGQYGLQNLFHPDIVKDFSKSNKGRKNSKLPKESSPVEETLGNKSMEIFLMGIKNTQDTNLKIYEKYSIEKAKNASKKMALIFITVLLLMVAGISTGIILYLYNKNQTTILSNKRQLEKNRKETKEILKENITVRDDLHKNIAQVFALIKNAQKKDNKIQTLEQRIKELEKENSRQEDGFSLS